MLAATSCADDELEPLYPNTGATEKINYTWAATADSMQQVTYNTYLIAGGTFKQDNAGNNNFNYWWNAHALDVLVDGFLRTKDESYKPKMKALVEGIKAKNGGTYHNDFVDDMEWLGIASLRAFTATNDPFYKEVAVDVWNKIKTAWTPVHGGGLQWKLSEPNGKNACSNGPGAILAMKLYQIDKKAEDLKWAKDIFAWQKATLVDPVSGLVWDNINMNNGVPVVQKDKGWVFTYNLGTYIGAAVELYAATKESSYLFDATKTATTTIGDNAISPQGILKSENQGDGGLFKGIFVRYFTQLIQTPDLSENLRTNYIRFLKNNAETFYTKGIGRPSMFASPDWKNKPSSSTDLSTQLSGIMLLEAAATLKEAGKL